MSLSSWLPGAKPHASTADPLSSLPNPPTLAEHTRLLVALSCRAASTTANPVLPLVPAPTRAWWTRVGAQWTESVCSIVELNVERIPGSVEGEQARMAAQSHWEGMTEVEKSKEMHDIAQVLVLASIFTPPAENEAVAKVELPEEQKQKANTKDSKAPSLSYTPAARALVFTALDLLSIPPIPHLSDAELTLSRSLFSTLQAVSDHAKDEEVEKTRQASAEGWGGKLGRNIATGVGVAIGGIAIGVTGGLAAPAIAALIPGFMTFGLLTTATAPVVLGSVFGLTAGGLTGRRVRERWSGVGEFEFVDVKLGTKRIESSVAESAPADKDPEKTPSSATDKKDDNESEEPVDAEKEVQANVDRRAEQLAYEPRRPKSTAPPAEVGQPKQDLSSKTSRLSIDSTRSDRPPSDEQIKALADKPPSLVATIAVPGLITVSPEEGIIAWQTQVVPQCFPDGRDVYVLKYETKFMLQTGKAIEFWITNKFKGYVKKQVIKRTLLNAYFAAVSLPLSVYSMATMGLDNTWMQSQDKARKAGKLLGEVLEKRVQGQRPVVLIGSSLGSLTVLHALLHLASLPRPHNLPQIVDSAYMVSLPSAPSAEEWAAVRGVVARRVVNGWCGKDLVLAGVVRLHEVLSRATTLQSGIRVAGLGPVEQPGIEDIDLSEVVDGHMDLQVHMPAVVQALHIDGKASEPPLVSV